MNNMVKNMDLLKDIITGILSLPKTALFNLRVFGIPGLLKMPVFVHWKVKVRKIYKGCIKIEAPLSYAMIRFGVGGTECLHSPRGELFFERGILRFLGKAHFASGVAIRNSGVLTIGDGFYANRNCRIACSREISLGNDVLLGWNVNIRDSDGHKVIVNNQALEKEKPVNIGNHVWLCSHAHVLKSVSVLDNSIIGYGSIVTKSFDEPNIAIGGNPAAIIKRNVNWEH